MVIHIYMGVLQDIPRKTPLGLVSNMNDITCFNRGDTHAASVLQWLLDILGGCSGMW